MFSPRFALLSSGLRTRRIPRLIALAAVVCACSLTATSARSFVFRTIDSQPIVVLASPSTVTGGNSVTVSITVDRVPSGGGSVQVGCDHSSAVTPPGGSWPYTLSFPSGGATTRSFTCSTSTVTTSTAAGIGSCPSGVNAMNSANWACSATATVTP